MVFPPVGLRQVGLLKQGMADTGTGTYPRRATLDIEMVPVLIGNSGGADVRVHEAVRQISGHSHQAPKFSNKHAVGMSLTGTTPGCSLFPGLLQVIIYRLGKAGNKPQFIKLAASTADHQPDMDVLDGLQLAV